MNLKKNQNEKLKRRKYFLWTLIIAVALFFPSWYLLGKWAKKHGFKGAGDFVKTVSVNYWNSFDASYENMEITISDADFTKLSEQRQQHLQRGIITKIEDRYVPALITYKGKKIKCRIRLKGHMTDHLQNRKWSLRVKTVGGDAFQGMRIFSLMHPGTRNYIYEWIYHQMLESEGIATIRYSFIKIGVNGENWGIYAIEENFADELLDHSKLPIGPILGFNPDLYWYARLNEFEKINVDLSDMENLSTSPEAYDEEENFKSKERRSDYSEAILKIEKFKRGELKTSEVFNIDKLARFHAILDLVGGQFSLDWSDVKYYYNPVTQLIEPVGYESFSVRNTNEICGSGKFKNNYGLQASWHERLFSDPEFFEKYVQHLLRVSSKKYLDKFFNKQEKALKNNLAILYTEFPYKKLELTQYFTNQKNIRTLLKTPISSMVYLENVNKDSIFLTVGNSSVLPVIINEIEVEGKKIKLKESLVFSARKKNEHVYFETIGIKIQDTLPDKVKKVKLYASYPGANAKTELEVKPVTPLPEFKDEVNQEANFHQFDFITLNEASGEIHFSSGNYVMDKNLILPEGYKIIVQEGFTLGMENNAMIVSKSPVYISGTEENPVQFISEDKSGRGILLLNCKEQSKFIHTRFVDLHTKSGKDDSHTSMLTLYQSPVKISECIFSSEAEKAITCYDSKAEIDNSTFFNLKGIAIETFYSYLKWNNIKFQNCKNAVKISGSYGSIDRLKAMKSSVAIKMDNSSFLKCKSWYIEDAREAVQVTDNSKLTLNGAELKNVTTGFIAEKKSEVYGPSFISITQLKKTKVKTVSETDNLSKVEIK